MAYTRGHHIRRRCWSHFGVHQSKHATLRQQHVCPMLANWPGRFVHAACMLKAADNRLHALPGTFSSFILIPLYSFRVLLISLALGLFALV
jgi:hypothetical protein